VKKIDFGYYITKKRFIIIFIVSFLLVDFYIAYRYMANKALEAQTSTVNSSYEDLRDSVSRLPNPEKLTPGLDAETTATAVRVTNEQSDSARQISLKFNCTTRDYFLLPKLCSDVGNNTAVINKELEQYSQILSSMEYLITFNPKFFALNYDKTSQKSLDKLTKLEDGLTESQQGLESMLKSKEKDDMLEIVKAVVGAKDRVKETGDAQPLEILVEAVQKELIKKLTEYYNNTVEDVRDNAQEIINRY
jgi:hypothetical protein